MNHITKFIEAVDFAANKHKFQRRKGYLRIPYINHPVKVCKILIDCGESDLDLLLAAVLHDTIEDTETSQSELIENFGEKVTHLVLEISDNMDLDEIVRKNLQVENASKLSPQASLIRIADKIANVSDIINYPINWTTQRKLKYIEWAIQVFNNCKGQNNKLDEMFVDLSAKARKLIEKE